MKLRKYVHRKYSVPKYIINALDTLRPPEDLTVSQWAERYRILDSKSSAVPGPWKNEMTPYLKGIMDEFNNWETEKIVFCKPTQVGGTEALNNMLGYIIAQDQSPTMIVYPTDILAETTSENRIQPMIEASSQLRRKYNAKKSSKTELQFDGMYITMTGSNTPSGLASKPIRYLFLDETDKYPGASKKEADPISLALERTKTFANRKIYMCSTPTLRTGPIWVEKEKCDIEKHYFVPCPHCGKYIELKWGQMDFPKIEGMSNADRAEQAVYICQECKGRITDRDKMLMLRRGEWRKIKEKTKFARSVAFWLNTLYSPFTRFSEIAKNFLDSKDDPESLHNFINSWLAEPWEDTKLKTNADTVMERQTELPEFVVPEWAKMLTAGVDVQETCLYYVIRAWGDFMTSQLITRGQAFSFDEITTAMNYSYLKENGEAFMVQLCLIDSGDQTDEVYEFASQNSEWCLPSKGTSTMLNHYKLSTVNRTSSNAYGMRLVLVDGGKYKDMIASRMKKPNGTGSWQVFNGIDREYAEQVTAEHKIEERGGGGKMITRWVPKTSHADNHYLDCEVYAFAAADVMGVRSLFLQNQDKDPQKYVEELKKQKELKETWLPEQNGEWI